MGRNKDGSVNYSPDGRVGSWDDYAGILLTVFLGTTSAFAAHESNNYSQDAGGEKKAIGLLAAGQ